ncbi:hypothetical protein [Amnibacterium endophyticum]|uniref:ABC transporter permease n=1 Tax=Amnibacterium endophyticum TaxID=2109337 RepID=A0ABW4LBA1_9MICO
MSTGSIAEERAVHVRSRGLRLLLGEDGDPVWVRPSLLALLTGSGVLYGVIFADALVGATH